ncbi:MAG: hypothetical protein B6I20_08585 [Bacteroidetes bacterium 4572_117]|nr:MAG: hypothetical protein B6I20_08585 [Bacteroidetes bacterium 4572_117]
MKKVLLGFISIIFATQVSFAQPVSDMAVIPMGITIQNIMRLTITKGGNMEFVFKTASDITNGLGPSTAYETEGSVVASQAWQLDLSVDAATFVGEVAATTIPLNVVEFTPTVAGTGAGTAFTGDLSNGWPSNYTIVNAGAVTSTATFNIAWECGTNNDIPATTTSGRYTINVLLSLLPEDGF